MRGWTVLLTCSNAPALEALFKCSANDLRVVIMNRSKVDPDMVKTQSVTSKGCDAGETVKELTQRVQYS